MRLPGSSNTKNGERIPVQVISDRPLRYELDDLAEWVSETRPLILRKGATQDGNPFLNVNVPGGGPPVDVAKRLADMRFRGVDDLGIHQTQVRSHA
jgi:hypothetical protein